MNVGPNRGRRLKTALSRFAAMLIEEARDISGLSYGKLDEALGLPDGQAKRYSLYPRSAKTRAPQAASIQQLENRVARFLERTAHIVVVENNAKIDVNDGDWFGHIEGRPSDDLNLREYDPVDFQLGYEGDWPTYRRLKYSSMALSSSLTPIHELIAREAHSKWQEMFILYSWQWGVLWDRGLPWLNRAEWNISPGAPVESFVPAITQKAKAERAAIAPLASSTEGRQRLTDAASYIDLLLESGPGERDAEMAINISKSSTTPSESH
jgi:hypothetical protein